MSFIQHNSIKKTLADLINKAIQTKFALQLDTYKLITTPPDTKLGEFTFPCFPLAKTAKKAPPLIAQELQAELEGKSPLIKEIKTAGPYLNFSLNYDKLLPDFLGQVLSGEYFRIALTEAAPKTMIEFSQPNTHKELHVGHMRNLCLGSALVNLHRYAGFETVSTTFPGDVGTHVAKCLWYMQDHSQEKAPLENKGAWLGSLYTKATLHLDELKATPEEKVNREVLTKILQQLEAKKGDYYELWKETRQWSIDLMQQVYDWAKVSFDIWYWESDVDSSSMELVREYQEQGLFVKDQGAIGIHLDEEKLGFCLLVKSDGTGLYATKDLELGKRKLRDHAIQNNLYVVDNRQALHFKQVFATLKRMKVPNADKCHHIQYEMVELPSGAMSSRKGNIVPLTQLIDKMEETIKKDYLAKYQEEWSLERIDKTASMIANGAIKYGMNRIDANKKIIFDMQEWLKIDGESGPYIQYTCARINSVLRKQEGSLNEARFELLSEGIERSIVSQLLTFNDVVESTLGQYKTHLLTNYLYDLSKAFNTYYAQCKFIGVEAPLANARLLLIQATRDTLEQGLALLGIEVPEQM